MLAGDLIMRVLQRRSDSNSAPVSLADFDQGGTDPGNIAAFLAFEIPFEVEPTTGFIFPEIDRD